MQRMLPWLCDSSKPTDEPGTKDPGVAAEWIQGKGRGGGWWPPLNNRCDDDSRATRGYGGSTKARSEARG